MPAATPDAGQKMAMSEGEDIRTSPILAARK
jgi:hypothetical protein